MTRFRLFTSSALAALLMTGSAMGADTVADRVDAALRDGAFQKAATIARGAETADIKATLLARIAAARLADMPAGDRVAGTSAATPELNGGSGANFGTLITLIQNQI